MLCIYITVRYTRSYTHLHSSSVHSVFSVSVFRPYNSYFSPKNSYLLLRVEYLSSGCRTEGYLGEVS